MRIVKFIVAFFNSFKKEDNNDFIGATLVCTGIAYAGMMIYMSRHDVIAAFFAWLIGFIPCVFRGLRVARGDFDD